jgi:hypothetical protein
VVDELAAEQIPATLLFACLGVFYTDVVPTALSARIETDR